ncbi:MAG: hypothetical protein KDB14_04285 [Planctomycetales bacterium]|nr:hypothetical protein [Planctomycetales bacterium]
MASAEFTSLLSQHIGSAFAKQIAFADFLGDHTWNVNISEGVASFGERSFPMQLLGTEAEGDATWLWAWANEGSNLPNALLHACQELRTLGERTGVPELVDPCFPSEVADGHAIALVASGLNPTCCYYRGPYEGGALFFLVCDAPDEVTRPVAAERIPAIFMGGISHFEINHRHMAESFLKTQGFDLDVSDLLMIATRDGQSLTLSFDDLGRIEKVDTTIGQ